MKTDRKNRRAGLALPILVLPALAILAGCDDSSPTLAVAPPPPVAAPTPAPAPPPQTSFSVQRCLDQLVAGRKLVDILVPDLLVLELQQPAAFPNGRRLEDPVIDLELAALFLDMTRHPVDTLVRVPVNPDQFDQPLRTSFPFFAAPLGSPPLSPSTGTNFAFRTDPATSYTRIDRAGIPAVSTAVVLGPRKNPYNDSTPAIDATGASVPDILAGYQQLTDSLNDDFRALGLTPCAT